MVLRTLVLVVTLFLLAAGLMARPQASEAPAVQAMVALEEGVAQEREPDDRIQSAGETVADVQDLLAGTLPVPDPGFSLARPSLHAAPDRPAPWLDGLRRPPKAAALFA